MQAAANAGTSAKTVSGRTYVHSSKLEEHISCCDMLLERQYETAPLDNDIYDLKKEIQDTIKRIIPAKTVISYAVSYTFNTLQQRLSSNKIGVIELENTIKAMTFLLALDEQQKVIESFLYIRELKKWIKQEWFEEYEGKNVINKDADKQKKENIEYPHTGEIQAQKKQMNDVCNTIDICDDQCAFYLVITIKAYLKFPLEKESKEDIENMTTILDLYEHFDRHNERAERMRKAIYKDLGLYLLACAALEESKNRLRPFITADLIKRHIENPYLFQLPEDGTREVTEFLELEVIGNWLLGKRNFAQKKQGIEATDSPTATCMSSNNTPVISADWNQTTKPGRKEKLSMEVFKKEIYPGMKIKFPDSKHVKGKKAYCTDIGQKYGVSEKTIRDKFDACNLGK